MCRSIILFVCCSLAFVIFASQASAASPYVLPYPSAMPGSRFYRVVQLIDEIKEKWYFGDFGSFTYARLQADKHLVEAKTLFEYGQHKLGLLALKKSDQFVRSEAEALRGVNKNGSISYFVQFQQQLIKHAEVLEEIAVSLPAAVVWEDEAGREELLLGDALESSVDLRKSLHE